MNKGLNVIFMGTPDFAVPTLVLLSKSHHRVAAVVTQPDRPEGRGRKLKPPPVKQTAIQLGYDILQPETLRTEIIINQLNAYKPDVFVVVAFGHILAERLLSIPKYGAINIHTSLLPKFRGPAPIPWAIINGEKETGVTTIQMDPGMDTGDILLFEKTPIDDEDTTSSLQYRLADLGAQLLIKTLDFLETQHIQSIPQNHSLSSYAPRLKKQDGHIEWSFPSEKIERWIRAMIPWPGAFTFHEKKRLKIFSSRVKTTDVGKHVPGTILKGPPDELNIATGKNALSILEIQIESGKKMLIKDFLMGYPFQPGDILA